MRAVSVTPELLATVKRAASSWWRAPAGRRRQGCSLAQALCSCHASAQVLRGWSNCGLTPGTRRASYSGTDSDRRSARCCSKARTLTSGTRDNRPQAIERYQRDAGARFSSAAAGRPRWYNLRGASEPRQAPTSEPLCDSYAQASSRRGGERARRRVHLNRAVMPPTSCASGSSSRGRLELRAASRFGPGLTCRRGRTLPGCRRISRRRLMARANPTS